MSVYIITSKTKSPFPWSLHLVVEDKGKHVTGIIHAQLQKVSFPQSYSSEKKEIVALQSFKVECLHIYFSIYNIDVWKEISYTLASVVQLVGVYGRQLIDVAILGTRWLAFQFPVRGTCRVTGLVPGGGVYRRQLIDAAPLMFLSLKIYGQVLFFFF